MWSEVAMRLRAFIALLLTLVITAGAAFFAYSGFFGVIEQSVYNPRVSLDIQSNLEKIAKASQLWHEQNMQEAKAYFAAEAVKKAMLPQQNSQDIFERARLFGQIQERNTYVLGVRIIAQDGKRMHFSTFAGDILRAEQERIVYRNYGSDTDVSIEKLVYFAEQKKPYIDTAAGAISYCFPFVDTFNVQSGVALLYVNIAGLQAELARQKLFPMGETIKPVAQGLVFGFPAVLEDAKILQAKIETYWSSTVPQGFITIGQTENSDTFILASFAGESMYYGRMVPASWFKFPPVLKVLLISIVFSLVYLILFLLLAARSNPVQVITHQIKKLQIDLINEYILEGLPIKERMREEFERKRPEVKNRIRQGLGKIPKKQHEIIDAVLDKGWDEIIEVFTRLSGETKQTDLSGIEAMLKEMLERWSHEQRALSVHAPNIPSASTAAKQASVKAPEPVEEAEVLEEAESVADEAEALEEIESVEEAAPLEEAEAIEEAEPAVEEAQALETPEPVEEAGALEEAESVAEEAEALEEIASLEEAAPLEEAEAIEETQPVVEEALEEAESVAEEAEALEEIEPVLEAEPRANTAELEQTLESAASSTNLIPAEQEIMLEQEAVLKTEPPEEAELLNTMSVEAIQEEIQELTQSTGYIFFENDEDEIPTIPENVGLEILEELNKEYIEQFSASETELEVEELVPYEEDGLIIEEPEQNEEAELKPKGSAKTITAAHIEEFTPEDFGATGKGNFERLEITSPFDSLEDDVLNDKELRKKMNQKSPEQAKVKHEIDELLGEVEFELFLDSFDLSLLENYNDEEGFLEIDEHEIRSILEDSGIEIVEADSSGSVQEIPMLTDEEREMLEELQLADLPDSEPVNAEPIDYLEQYIRRCLPGYSIKDCIEGELETVDDESPTTTNDIETSQVITENDGIYTLNRSAVSADIKLDASLKKLADDVLGKK